VNVDPIAPRERTFPVWLEEVARITLMSLERDLVDLESDLGPLPLELGYDSGDSPSEFIAGAIVPLLEKRRR
jgi:hypothetical protein